MNPKFDFYYEILKRMLIEKVRGDPDLQINFDAILEIHSHSGLGISTLKRIFGVDSTNPDYRPSPSSLHKLARFLDFPSWNEFVRVHSQKEVETGNSIDEPFTFLRIPRIGKFIKERSLQIISFNILSTLILTLASIFLTWDLIASPLPLKFDSSSLPIPIPKTGPRIFKYSKTFETPFSGWNGYFDVSPPKVNITNTGAASEADFTQPVVRSIHIPKWFRVVKVEYFLGGVHWENCQAGLSSIPDSSQQINVSLDESGRILTWRRVYMSVPCDESYRLFYRQVLPTPKEGNITSRRKIDQNLKWLWSRTDPNRRGYCEIQNIYAGSSKLGKKSGRDCVKQAIREARNGFYHRVIPWLKAYHCPNHEDMTLYEIFPDYTLYRLFILFSQQTTIC